jgi:hypothetical protein
LIQNLTKIVLLQAWIIIQLAIIWKTLKFQYFILNLHFNYIKKNYLDKMRSTQNNAQVAYIQQQQITAEPPPTYNEVI